MVSRSGPRRAGRGCCRPLCLGCSEIVSNAGSPVHDLLAGLFLYFRSALRLLRNAFRGGSRSRSPLRRLPRPPPALPSRPGCPGLRRSEPPARPAVQARRPGRTSHWPAAAGWRGRAPISSHRPTSWRRCQLHWRRLFMRRYNQAQLLARIVVRTAGRGRDLQLAPDLLRRRSAGPVRRPASRRRSVGATCVRPSTSIRNGARWWAGKSILLVDDVLTTQGPRSRPALARCKRADARRVDVLTLARGRPAGVIVSPKRFTHGQDRDLHHARSAVTARGPRACSTARAPSTKRPT
jgi:hypothetical protein